MVVLHLATWFPSKENELSGIFIQKHVEAISQRDKENQHIVISLNHTFLPVSNLLKFIALPFNKLSVKESKQDNYLLFEPNFLVSHKQLFGDISSQLFRQIIQVLKDRNIRPGLIHAHVVYTAGSIATMLNERIKVPFIISEHMSPFPFPWMKKQPFCDIHIKKPIACSKAVIAVSSHLKSEIVETAGHSEKISIIGNVVDVPIRVPKSLSDPVQFILVGTLTPSKGIDILINAVSILNKQEVRDFKITIAGDGPLNAELKQLAKQKQVDNHFVWLGLVNHDKLIGKIQQSDAFICASRHESFGVAIVEALACGKPVVATNCGGPSDTINDTNGIIVENENPAALAKGINDMLTHLQDYDAELISADAMQKFSAEAIGSKYLSLYSNLHLQAEIVD